MILGWDIGGVNTKVALVEAGRVLRVLEASFELQRDPSGLVPLLRRLACDTGARSVTAHAVTMTAELSQMFRTKREGVGFVLDAVVEAFPDAPVHVWTVDARFTTTAEAVRAPLGVAAANWMATAVVVAQRYADALLVDVGSTTTDIVPIAGGRVVATGRTDIERLASGELVYTGALRTPVEAIVQHVTVDGRRVAVSAEGFVLAGDVHRWRGDLAEADYTVPTPDGRPVTRDACAERLMRLVCADREMLGERDVSAIADEVANAQVRQIADAIAAVASDHATVRRAVVTGRGAFIAAAAAQAAGLDVLSLDQEMGPDAARSAPAAAVALLCEQRMEPRPGATDRPRRAGPGDQEGSRGSGLRGPALADLIVKIGGGLLGDPAGFRRILDELEFAAGRRVVIVPGGGPFADAVREADRRFGITDSAAHWMAIGAMDQYAELIVSRVAGAVRVTGEAGIREALAAGDVPVVAPARWLRRADPLPHSWDVTSDSIAAWVAGVTGAGRLILVKPAGARQGARTDPYFERALPDGVEATSLFLDEPGALRAVLQGVPVSGFAVASRWPSP